MTSRSWETSHKTWEGYTAIDTICMIHALCRRRSLPI